MKQKVLFINPPYQEVYRRVSKAKGCSNPINLAYLAAYIRNLGMDVEIFDANALEIGWDDFRKKMPKDFEFVGVGSYSPSLHLSIRALEIARQVNTGCITIIGGPHFSGDPLGTMVRFPVVDFGIKQEGEITFYELIHAIDNNSSLEEIPGLVFRKNDEVKVNPDRPLIKDIDALPMPAYDLLPMERYRLPLHHITVKDIPTSPASLLFTSRGCPFSCTFCASKVSWGKTVRYHSPGRVLEEILLLRDHYNVRTFEFADDNFTVNKRRMNTILDRFINEKINVNFNCLSRVNVLSEENMIKLKKGGCYLVRMGIESGSQTILDKISKGTNLDQARKTFALLKRCGLGGNASMIVGTPGETWKTVEETLNFLKEIEPDIVYFFIATPLVGTEMRQEMIDKNLLANDRWDTWEMLSKPVASTERMTLEEVAAAQKMLYRKFYFRPKYVLSKLGKIKSARVLGYYLKGLTAVFNLACGEKNRPPKHMA